MNAKTAVLTWVCDDAGDEQVLHQTTQSSPLVTCQRTPARPVVQIFNVAVGTECLVRLIMYYCYFAVRGRWPCCLRVLLLLQGKVARKPVKTGHCRLAYFAFCQVALDR